MFGHSGKVGSIHLSKGGPQVTKSREKSWPSQFILGFRGKGQTRFRKL